MNTITINYPGPPVDAVMPATGQTILLGLSTAIVLVTLVFAIRMAAKYKSALPVLFMVAGFCTVILEPMVDNFGHIVFPEIGQIMLFKTHDRAIPVFVALIYAFYFPIVFLTLFPRIVNNDFTAGLIWKSFFIALVPAWFLEMIPIRLHWWIYYDNQALWLWKNSLPLFWVFVNITCVFVALTLIKFLYPLMKGWKQLLVIVLSPMGAVMGHFGAGFPFYNATNSTASPLVVNLCGLVSIGLCFLIMMICVNVLVNKNCSYVRS
ncbi:MAG: hypothetical protein HKP58_07770 [Desulfatitalea sp.]|nr:hypothetical protein [Desulfatitalea sp.]NNK00297.1 hypothetical protein [Desulfatitalea sp.]